MALVFKQIQIILLVCIAFSLAFSIPFSFSHAKLNNVFIALLSINALAGFIFSSKEPKPEWNPMLVLFAVVYILYVAGLLHTENLKQGLYELEKKIGLILFPVIFYFTARLSMKEINSILLSFVLGCLLTGVVCISIATYRFLDSGETKYFFYHDLSEIAGMHAIYLSIYCCFSTAIIINWWSETKSRMYLSMLFCFLILIFLLGGRTQIFTLIFASVSYSIYRFNKKSRLIYSIIKALGIGVLIAGVALLFPTNRERFKQAINYKGQYGLNREWGEQQMRPLIWDCVLKNFQSSPVFGTGTGDVEDDLQKCYIEHDYVSLLLWEPIRFNAHNQFFETTLGLGVIGLLFFLTSLGLPLYQATVNKHWLYVIFILLFIISCLTESLLQRHNGIVFFSFFNAFLYFNMDVIKIQQEKST